MLNYTEEANNRAIDRVPGHWLLKSMTVSSADGRVIGSRDRWSSSLTRHWPDFCRDAINECLVWKCLADSGGRGRHKFSDAAKSALLLFIVMPGGGSAFGAWWELRRWCAGAKHTLRPL